MKVSIPDFLIHLPVDPKRGYPIPYFVPIVNGEANFSFMDGKKHADALKYNKCCICGRKLVKNVYWFISGPEGFKNKIDSHAPMHERCARYALETCPHLMFKKLERKTGDIKPPSDMILSKPDYFYLTFANKFSTMRNSENTYDLVKFNCIRFEMYGYIENKLTRL